MEKGEILYSGKAKSVYRSEHPDQFILHFRDDTSAFDGKKVEQLARKGAVNNQFNGFIMSKLEEAGIATHFIKLLGPVDSLVKRLEMIPLECVVRNVAAGSLCRRLGIEEGIDLKPPVFELFLKDDGLGDPMVNPSHALTFGWATPDQLAQMEILSLAVNDVLSTLFADAGLILVDYKLEFGLVDGVLVLGDEFSPDGCRVWDRDTRRKLDKDRFRQGLGGVIESYEEIAERLGVSIKTE